MKTTNKHINPRMARPTIDLNIDAEMREIEAIKITITQCLAASSTIKSPVSVTSSSLFSPKESLLKPTFSEYSPTSPVQRKHLDPINPCTSPVQNKSKLFADSPPKSKRSPEKHKKFEADGPYSPMGPGHR